MGYYDAKGQLYFVERVKSMIKCMNNQVAPGELESILLGHEAVREVTVIGTPDPKYGEAPTACVVLKNTCSASQHVIAKELKQLVEGRLIACLEVLRRPPGEVVVRENGDL